MKWIPIGIIGVLGLVALGVLGGIWIPRWIAPEAGLTEEIEITNRGAYRIQGYERFYDLYEEVEAIDVKLQAYPLALDVREETECRGLLMRRADMVRQYNADSQAVRTVGQWRADNLPSRISHDLPRECGR